MWGPSIRISYRDNSYNLSKYSIIIEFIEREIYLNYFRAFDEDYKTIMKERKKKSEINRL